MGTHQRQMTFASHGHMLTNCNSWSPDSRRIVYDVRSDPAGSVFDGTRIETVDVESGEVRVVYESRNGACCGVATYSTTENRVVFIHGPEFPDATWNYGMTRRQGVMVDEARPGIAINLDARDMMPPFTAGALRGGSHVHIFSRDGKAVTFTYEDQFLGGPRNIGVSVMGKPVKVPNTHPRNHDGVAFSVLVTRTVERPTPGSDEISRACEEGWIGSGHRAFAFVGHTMSAGGQAVAEVFLAELPEDLTVPGDGPLQGTATEQPCPPKGTIQRRLTHTKGIDGPRHWMRSNAEGTRIGYLMRDDAGIVQFWTVSPTGSGSPTQITRAKQGVQSSFSWHDERVALVMDRQVCVVEMDGGTKAFTEPCDIRPESCVFSPDGTRVAYVRNVRGWNQIFVVDA